MSCLAAKQGDAGINKPCTGCYEVPAVIKDSVLAEFVSCGSWNPELIVNKNPTSRSQGPLLKEHCTSFYVRSYSLRDLLKLITESTNSSQAARKRSIDHNKCHSIRQYVLPYSPVALYVPSSSNKCAKVAGAYHHGTNHWKSLTGYSPSSKFLETLLELPWRPIDDDVNVG